MMMVEMGRISVDIPDKLEKASLNNTAYALSQVHGALRLEQGQSTSNISYADALASLREAKTELKKLNESVQQETCAPAAEPEAIPIIKEL